MAQLESEPVALPEGVTLATAGTFTVEPGRSVDRDGARFTCAAGGAACTVVVAERAGGGFAATVTGGRVMVAAAAPGGGGQNGGVGETDWPFPDWPVADAATTRSLMGGSALSWTSSEIRNRLGESMMTHKGDLGYARGDAFDQTITKNCLTRTDVVTCNEEYQPVMTYHGIPIVQTRVLRHGDGATPFEGTNDTRDVEGAIFGILDYGYFGISWENTIERAGGEFRELEAFFLGAGRRGNPRVFHIFTQSSQRTPMQPGREITGRWRGALFASGVTTNSPLYRQFIMGDVDIVVRPLVGEVGDFARATPIDIEFSNVRNIGTGEAVTLPRTQWPLVANGTLTTGAFDRGKLRFGTNSPEELQREFGGQDIVMRPIGPNAEEILGWFGFHQDPNSHLIFGIEGVFGAKKQ